MALPNSTQSLPRSQQFLNAFPTYVRLDVACTQYNEAEPHRFLSFLQESLGTLADHITKENPGTRLLVWPNLFAFSKSESAISYEVKQDRGTMLIGVEGESVQPGSFAKELGLFIAWVKDSGVFLDERVPPSISIVHVPKEKLGHLVVDDMLWPQPADAYVSFIASGGEDDEGTVEEFLNSVTDDAPHHKEDSQNPSSTSPQKLRPASDVLNRLRWDASHGPQNYTVIYLDRFTGFQEIPVDQWRSETTEEDFVPQHRITSFRNRTTGQIIWHREERLDLVFRGS